jgi:hypothetical protein
VIAGLGGAILMMMIEMLLYITRSAKLEQVEKQYQKKKKIVF